MDENKPDTVYNCALCDAEVGAGGVLCEKCLEALTDPKLRKMVRLMVNNYRAARSAEFIGANLHNEKVS